MRSGHIGRGGREVVPMGNVRPLNHSKMCIRDRDKNVLEIYNAMGAEAKKHASGQREAVSCGTDEELRKIIRAYYLDPKSLKKKLLSLIHIYMFPLLLRGTPVDYDSVLSVPILTGRARLFHLATF